MILKFMRKTDPFIPFAIVFVLSFGIPIYVELIRQEGFWIATITFVFFILLVGFFATWFFLSTEDKKK